MVFVRTLQQVVVRAKGRAVAGTPAPRPARPRLPTLIGLGAECGNERRAERPVVLRYDVDEREASRYREEAARLLASGVFRAA